MIKEIVGHLSAPEPIFSGSLLLKDELKIGGIITSDNIQAKSNISAMGDVRGKTLHADEGAGISGDLKVKGSIILNGQKINPDSYRVATGSTLNINELTTQGALKVLGDITIKGIAKFLDDVDVEGTLKVKGDLSVNDRQAGYAVIPVTGKSVTVPFDPPADFVPVITAAPSELIQIPWWVSSASSTGFTISIEAPAPHTMTFSWHALHSEKPVVTDGNPSDKVLIFPIDEFGVPISLENDQFNECIRHRASRCDRYYQGNNKWEHPDFPGLEFFYSLDKGLDKDDLESKGYTIITKGYANDDDEEEEEEKKEEEDKKKETEETALSVEAEEAEEEEAEEVNEDDNIGFKVGVGTSKIQPTGTYQSTVTFTATTQ